VSTPEGLPYADVLSFPLVSMIWEEVDKVWIGDGPGDTEAMAIRDLASLAQPRKSKYAAFAVPLADALGIPASFHSEPIARIGDSIKAQHNKLRKAVEV
jgi:hypothetical protein